MKTIEFDGNLLELSNEVFDEFETKNSSYFVDWGRKQLGGVHPAYKKFISAYGKLNGLEGNAILFSHGVYDGKTWYYLDSSKKRKVQNWIKKRDGKYAGLFLCLCNKGNLTPKSKKSLVLFPDREISSLIGPEGCYDLLVPGGKLITEYTIERDLEDLEFQLKKLNKNSIQNTSNNHNRSNNVSPV